VTPRPDWIRTSGLLRRRPLRSDTGASRRVARRTKDPLMIIRKDDAPLFEQGGTRATGYASPSRGVMDTSGRAVGTRPGTQSPVHVLDRNALRGRARGQLGERRYKLGAGDCLVVHPGKALASAIRTGTRSRPSPACRLAGARRWRTGGGSSLAGRYNEDRVPSQPQHPRCISGGPRRAAPVWFSLASHWNPAGGVERWDAQVG
jgi:hypothetical protein